MMKISGDNSNVHCFGKVLKDHIYRTLASYFFKKVRKPLPCLKVKVYTLQWFLFPISAKTILFPTKISKFWSGVAEAALTFPSTSPSTFPQPHSILKPKFHQ